MKQCHAADIQELLLYAFIFFIFSLCVAEKRNPASHYNISDSV